MSVANFNSEGFDSETFTPFVLFNALETEWKDIRLSFFEWEWLHRFAGGESLENYYLNGEGIQGLIMACRMNAGLEIYTDDILYNSEGDTCFIQFKNLKDAEQTALLAAEMCKDREKLVAMMQLARENDLSD